MEYVQLIVGLLILIASGEALVKGSVGIALKLHISTLVIGMTIVSFGTSAPELLVTLKAAFKGMPDIAVGTVVGSNVSNLALILGLTAIVFPIRVKRDSIAIDWPMMMIATIIFYLAIWNGLLSFLEGLGLFGSLVLFGTWLIWRSRVKTKKNLKVEEQSHEVLHPAQFVKFGVLIVLGCVGLVFGADMFLDGAGDIAYKLGISQRVIGLTLVAFGTSLPELITSLVAAFRKQSDIGIGNLIGSNIFNLLAILGITSMVKDIPVHEKIINIDFFWMLAGSLIIFPMMFFRKKIGRIEGLILVVFYTAYVYFVFKM